MTLIRPIIVSALHIALLFLIACSAPQATPAEDESAEVTPSNAASIAAPPTPTPVQGVTTTPQPTPTSAPTPIPTPPRIATPTVSAAPTPTPTQTPTPTPKPTPSATPESTPTSTPGSSNPTEEIPPCTPLPGSDVDPCQPDIERFNLGSGGAGSGPNLGDEPRSLRRMLNYARTFVSHIVVRGTYLPDTERCTTGNPYRPPSYLSSTEYGDLIYALSIDCYVDLRGRLYPRQWTVHLDSPEALLHLLGGCGSGCPYRRALGYEREGIF